MQLIIAKTQTSYLQSIITRTKLRQNGNKRNVFVLANIYSAFSLSININHNILYF